MLVRFLFLMTLVFGLACSRSRETTPGQEDFEFVEDAKEKVSSESKKGSLVWISDPDNELCNLLRCGHDEHCLLQDKLTAVCVNKEEAARYGDRIVPLKDATREGQNGFDSLSSSSDESTEDYDEDEDYLNDEEDEDFDSDEEDQKEDNGLPKLIRKPFARKQCPSCPVVRPVFLCGSDNKTYSSLCRMHLHNCIHEASVRIACKGFCPCRDTNSHQARKEKQRQRMNSYMSKLRSTANNEGKSDQGQSERKNQARTQGTHSRGSSSHYSRSKMHKKYSKSNGDGGGHSSYPKYASKYSKQGFKNDKYWGRKKDWPESRKNEVTYKATNSVWGTNECSQEALEAMGNRMLDWFSVIMADSRRRPANPLPGPSWCKREVSWMLGHLDQDADERLSVKELYRLEHDDRERCIKPFIDRCDLDRDLYLSAREWCKCFDKSERPCAALRKASKGLLGGYIPECDSEGYYRPMQCHVSAAMCWCVDKHGVEIPGSRTRETPNCDSVSKNRLSSSNHIDDDTENDPDDVDNYEGSADKFLDI